MLQSMDSNAAIPELSAKEKALGFADQVRSDMGDQIGKFGNQVGNGVDWALNTAPVRAITEPVGSAVGEYGKALGGLVGGVGNVLGNAIQKKPFGQNFSQDVMNTAESTGNFGNQIGKHGAEASLIGGAGKVAGTIASIPPLARGFRDILKDQATPETGMDLGVGAAGLYGAVNNPNWTPGGILDKPLKNIANRIGQGVHDTSSDATSQWGLSGKGQPKQSMEDVFNEAGIKSQTDLRNKIGTLSNKESFDNSITQDLTNPSNSDKAIMPDFTKSGSISSFRDPNKTYMILTPENPMGTQASPEYNTQARKGFESFLTENKIPFQPQLGVYGNPENSYILGINDPSQQQAVDAYLQEASPQAEHILIKGGKAIRYSPETQEAYSVDLNKYGKNLNVGENVDNFYSKIGNQKYKLPLYSSAERALPAEKFNQIYNQP